MIGCFKLCWESAAADSEILLRPFPARKNKKALIGNRQPEP
jgi:hypothetical protein